MARRTATGIYVPIGLDTQQINQDIERLRVELTSLASNMSGAFNSSLNPQTLINNFGRLTQSLGNIRDAARALQDLRPFGNFEQMLNSTVTQQPLRELAQTLGITEQAQRRLLSTMARTTAISQQVNGLRQLERQMGMTRQETLRLADSLGMTIDRAARLQYLGNQGRGILGAFSPSNMTAAMQSAMGAMGVVGGAYGVVELGKSMARAALQMDNIKIAFESIYGSSAKAEVQLKFVRQVADNLGLSFITAAEGAKKLFAAINNTEYASSANKVFQAFSNAGAALKLDSNNMNRVFLAVSQVYSKGKVAAEELRSQIAEVLPGAVTLFAQSIGVTTRELDKMLQDGAVGLEHMEKFADALQNKYSQAAAAASTGLQAELNRVSNAWFDLKKAFVDTESSADLVRQLGNALKYLGDNATSIAAVVKELLKFGGATAGIYLVITAVQKLAASFVGLWSAVRAGSLATLFASTGPAGVGVGALAVGIGGLVYALMNMDDGLSESDKRLKKFGEQTFDLEQSIRALGGATEQTTEELEKLQRKELEADLADAKKALDSLFMPGEKNYDVGSYMAEAAMAGVSTVIIREGKNEFDKAFDELGKEVKSLTGNGKIASDFEEAARNLTQKFKDGMENNLSAQELGAIQQQLNILGREFALTLRGMENAQGAEKAFEKIKNMIGNILEKNRRLIEDNEQLAKGEDKIAEAAGKSEAAYEAIEKLTKGTASGKESKLATEFTSIIDNLIVLSRNAEDAKAQIEALGDGADKSTEDFRKLKTQTDDYEAALPRIADLAIQSGIGFDRMSDALDELFYAAKITYGELVNLKAVLSSFMNMRVGEVIGKAIDELGNKAKMAKATGVQKTIIDTLTKGIPEAEKRGKITDLVIGGKWDELGVEMQQYNRTAEDIEKVRKFSEEINAARGGGRKRGGGRSRSGGRSTTKTAAQQMSEATKEADSLQKKIAALQAQYDDDPSIKYWADVTAELDKINNILNNKMGASTEAEKTRLAGLRDDYMALAKARKEQMEQEERRQKAIEAANKLGKGYGNLSDVSGTINPELQTAALKAEYEQMRIAWDKALNDQTVSYEQYVQGIADLSSELKTKTDMANGSMVANFTDHVNESYEKIKDWQSQVSDILMNGVNSMSSAFATFFIDAASGTEDLEKAFSNMVKSMINSLADLFMQMVIIGTLKQALGIGGSFFGGGTAAQAKAGPSQGGFSTSSAVIGKYNIPAMAKGGVVSGIGSFSGKVVKGPTMFNYGGIKKFARGAGLMGEAGWEAVMPLIRTRGGNLGVRAEGMGGSNVEMNQDISINIVNNSDSQVSASKSRDNSGNVNIEVMIEKLVGDSMRRPGSAPFRALQDTYGATTVLAKR